MCVGAHAACGAAWANKPHANLRVRRAVGKLVCYTGLTKFRAACARDMCAEWPSFALLFSLRPRMRGLSTMQDVAKVAGVLGQALQDAA